MKFEGVQGKIGFERLNDLSLSDKLVKTLQEFIRSGHWEIKRIRAIKFVLNDIGVDFVIIKELNL